LDPAVTSSLFNRLYPDIHRKNPIRDVLRMIKKKIYIVDVIPHLSTPEFNLDLIFAGGPADSMICWW